MFMGLKKLLWLLAQLPDEPEHRLWHVQQGFGHTFTKVAMETADQNLSHYDLGNPINFQDICQKIYA